MIRTWQEALDYLYRRTNLETGAPRPRDAYKLDRVRALLAELGEPQQRWPALHVAGTNGKGSTCALLAAALRASGYRVGLYTSPHLHTVRERIQVDGALISEAAVVAWLNAREALLARHAGLTTFELLTALAFDYFAARAVDVAVVEVGLGGRVDTTNVVQPVVSVICPIDLDHVAILGNSLEAIALDKAGILRPGIGAVSAPQQPAAAAVIAATAADIGAPLYRVGHEAVLSEATASPDGQQLRVTVFRPEGPQDYPVSIALDGAHQRDNAATAVLALDVLARQGWQVDAESVAAGFRAARWPARFERLGEGPVLVVDAAHNPHGARALTAALDARYTGRRRLLLLGASSDKDVDGVLAALLPGAAYVFTTQADHPRAMPATDLAERVSAAGGTAQAVRRPASALAAALAVAGVDDVIVAAGSVFLAADVREAWAALGLMAMPPRDPPRYVAT